VAVLLRLALTPDESPPLAKLGTDLRLSASEVHGAINRASAAGLLNREQRRPHVSQLLEFLEHGIRYVFIPHRSGITRGIPTAHSAHPLSDELLNPGTPNQHIVHGLSMIVWPHPEGEVRGAGLEPLYASSVEAARSDPRLHECLALVDALRIGGARERKLAIDLLATRLRPRD
jgi:hypothetical protein